MSQTPNPNDPRPSDYNPSVESTRRDDALDKRMHEDAAGFGTAAGTTLGCLGVTFAPWLAILFAIAAAGVFIVVARGCGDNKQGTTQRTQTPSSDVRSAAAT